MRNNTTNLYRCVRKLIILFFIIVWSTSLYSQLYNFTNYTIEQGLPQSTVFCIFQDTRGYLWVGTEGGAARFDGKHFDIFDNTNGLPGNSVRSIFEDANGALWFGTDKGIGIYNGINWKIIDENNGLQGSAILKLTSDKQGRTWVATNDAGINIIDFSNDSLQIQNINSNHGLSGDFVLDILSCSNGETLLATLGGINSIKFIDDSCIVSDLSTTLNLISPYISCIDEDTQGNLWIGTLDAGAFKWNTTTSKVEPYGVLQGISDTRIWDIFCDADGSVWFASEKSGIFRLNNQVVQHISALNGLPGNQIFCIYRDQNRNLWMGSVGQGLAMFQGFQLVHYSITDGLPGTSILAVKADMFDNIWVGANQQGLAMASIYNDKLSTHLFTSTQGYHPSDVTSIDFDNQGSVIAGTRGNGLLTFKNNAFWYITVDDGLLNNNINCVYNTTDGSIYVGSDLGFNEIAGQQIHAITEEEGLINSEVQTVMSDKQKNIWMGTLGGLARFQAKTSEYRDFNEEEGLFDLGIHALVADKNNNLWLGTSNGIYNYYPASDTITLFTQIKLNSKTINSLLFVNDSVLIAGTSKGFNKIVFNSDLSKVKKLETYDKSNGFIWSETNFNAICSDSKNHVWLGTVNGLTSYRPELEDTTTVLPIVRLTNLQLSFENVDWKARGYQKANWSDYPEKLSLPHNQNHLTFNFVGIYLKNPEKVMFKYKLEPSENKWSPITENTSVTYPGLSSGKYKFSIVASADGTHWSEAVTYDYLVIRPPFWKTWWFILLSLMAIAFILVIIVRRRELKLRKEKIHLEKIVRKRTAEVVAQKDEIEHQKEEITGSITYAQRIQQAILPGIENLRENTTDGFILFKPRDIVSGDYYWIERVKNNLIVAAADCTGHGVPGAFMSMLGVSFMNKIVNEQGIESPDIILEHMRSNVIESLKQGCHEGSTKDGMDMAICVVNVETLLMTFAGAYNSAIVISNGEANEIKADRMPVGYHIVMHEYTPTQLQLQKGDCIYLYSDGFQDQIGGPNTRKFMKKNMRELLVKIHSKPFKEQQQILDRTIEDWKNHPDGKTDQMDDILIIGFQV